MCISFIFVLRGESGSKKDLIDVAKAIAEASEEVTRCARKLGETCTDVRIKNVSFLSVLQTLIDGLEFTTNM